MASVAVVTAVSKPKVTSVPHRSLSMVLGTPMKFMPFLANFAAEVIVPSPPMQTRASMSRSRRRAEALVGDVLTTVLASALDGVAEGIGGVARAQDGAAEGEDVADVVVVQPVHAVLDQAEVAVLDAPDRQAVLADGGLGDRPDDGVQSGAVAAAGHDGDRLQFSPGHADFSTTSSLAW